jgi:hypothetical protein
MITAIKLKNRYADDLLEEIERNKAELSAARGHSVERLFAEARERQKHSGHRIVNLQDERKEISYALRDAPRKKNNLKPSR